MQRISGSVVQMHICRLACLYFSQTCKCSYVSDCILPGSLEQAHQHIPGACGPIIEQASEDVLAIGDELYDESPPVEKLGTGITSSRYCFPVLKYVHMHVP